MVLYGAGADSLDSAVAADKLGRAGFLQIFDYRGGRTAWAQGGGQFEGDGPLPPAPSSPEDTIYTVNPEKSRFEWMGCNLASTHRGTIRIASGQINLEKGQLSGGSFTLDMSSIQNTDLTDPDLRKMLENHLLSDDFFDADRYPTAVLEIRRAELLPNPTPGAPNHTITAELTLKDVSREIQFPAVVAVGEDGTLIANAQVEIDRTQWNVIYGSGRFFRMLGKHLVNDSVTLNITLVAERSPVLT